VKSFELQSMLTLHHLNFSRSTRVIWLLEELQLDYRLEAHSRTPGFAAPDSLRLVHPLGKAPVLDCDGVLIAESAVILTYLCERHGAGQMIPSNQRLAHDQWLHWAESSAAGPLMILLYASFQGGLSGVCAAIVERDSRQLLGDLAASLKDGPYILGGQFTIADIQLSYVVELAEYLNLLEPYPSIRSYHDRLRLRPAYAAAQMRGGPMFPPRQAERTRDLETI
jgi:glutathione S-transferase